MPRAELARHAAILFIVSGIVFFFNLGTPRLWDRDEPRNAGCTAEMLARGDWVVPVFNGQLREQKPALLYWLMMATYAIVGVNEWGARLPSAILAVGTVFTTYAIGRRLFGASAGLWGALALATSLMFDVAARAATPDSTFIFFTTLAMAVFVYGFMPSREESATKETPLDEHQFADWSRYWQPLSRKWAWPLYLALGLAVLAKGPVGLVLPVAVLGMFLLVARLPRTVVGNATTSWPARLVRLAVQLIRPFEPRNFLGACRQLRPGLCLAIVAAVALPWYVWVGLRTDSMWLEGFLWNDNVRRVLEPLENHRGSILYYPATLLVGFFPWSVFAAPVVLETWARMRGRDRLSPAYLLCLCWVGVYVGLFSLARTKLPSYITPCYPALALLTGAYLARWIEGTSLAARWWPRVSLGVLAGVGCALLVVLPLAARQFLPGEEWLGVVALVPTLGAAVGLWFAFRQRCRLALGAMAVTAALVQGTFFGGVLVRIDERQQSDVLFAEISRRSADPRVATFGCLESSWVYYSGCTIQEFMLDGRPVAAKLPRSFVAERARRTSNVRELAAQSDAFIITTRRYLPALQAHLSPEMGVLAEVPYFLEDEQLVLVGRSDVTPSPYLEEESGQVRLAGQRSKLRKPSY